MTRIAFVSCANVDMKPDQPAWQQIAAAQPDLLLLLGDNAYMSWDGPGWDHAKLEASYRAQTDIAAFRHLLHSVPSMAIWDDHDCGPNDVLGGEADPQDVRRSRALFDRYLPGVLNTNRPRMYCWHDVGEVRVFMLDVRTWRTRSGGSAPTMLGAEQEQWLLDALAECPQPYIVIGSGTPISEAATGHGLQDYTGFWTRLKPLLQHRPTDARPRKVLFLSGDIHDNAWVRHDGFYEAISSGVACLSRGDQLPTDNWGLLDFDADKDRVKITLSGHWPSYVGVHRVKLSAWTENLNDHKPRPKAPG